VAHRHVHCTNDVLVLLLVVCGCDGSSNSSRPTWVVVVCRSVKARYLATVTVVLKSVLVKALTSAMMSFNSCRHLCIEECVECCHMSVVCVSEEASYSRGMKQVNLSMTTFTTLRRGRSVRNIHYIQTWKACT